VDDWRAARRQGETERENFLEDWTDVVRAYNTAIKPKYAPLSLKNHLSTVRSFFSFWKIPVPVDLPRHAYVMYHNRDLTREDVREILGHATPRDRAVWLLMAESGLRAQTAVGIRYRDIKEDFEKRIVPCRILTPAATLKDHVGDRWTFIGEDGVRELREYLKPRLPLKDEDYVFASEKPGLVSGDQFSVSSLSVKFNRLVQKLAMVTSRGGKPKDIRMHGLRKYFRNNMKAEAAFREFWMGHSLGVDAHYITRDPEVHRKEYAKGYQQLRIFDSMTEGLDELRESLQLKMKTLKDENQDLAKQVQDLKVKQARILLMLVDLVGQKTSPRDLEKRLKELET